MEISDHIVVLDYGEKISDGSAEFVRTDPSVIAAYLGVDDEEVDEVESALDEKRAPAAVDPVAASAPAPAAAAARPQGLPEPRGGIADDLKKIKGIGRQNEARLNALGIFHFDQIAAWTPGETEWVGDHLAFPGRIEREDWIGQARRLCDTGPASGGAS